MKFTQTIKEYINFTKPLSFLIFKRERPLVVINPSEAETKNTYILYFKMTGAHYRVIFLDDLLNENFSKSFVFNDPEERAGYYFTHGILDNYFDVIKEKFYD